MPLKDRKIRLTNKPSESEKAGSKYIAISSALFDASFWRARGRSGLSVCKLGITEFSLPTITLQVLVLGLPLLWPSLIDCYID